MIRKLVTTGMAAAVVALGLAGCSDTNTSASGTSRISVKLTDAPPMADITQAVVTISKIYLSGAQVNDSMATEDEVLLSAPVTTDLLTLSNDVMTLVDGQPVTAGTYGQMRFVVDGAYIVVNEDGMQKVYATPGYSEVPSGMQVDGTLKCPSCSQSGIKVNFPNGALTLDQDRVVLVDFDVAQTFGHQAGQSGMWVMHPALNATDVQLSGSVHVTAQLDDGVTLPAVDSTAPAPTLADFQAELRTPTMDPSLTGELASFSDTNGDGVYDANFDFVVPGTYLVNLLAPVDTAGNPLIDFATDPSIPQSITVDSEGDVTLDFTLTSAVADTMSSGG